MSMLRVCAPVHAHAELWPAPSEGFTLNWALGWQSAGPSDAPISTDPGLGLLDPS